MIKGSQNAHLRQKGIPRHGANPACTHENKGPRRTPVYGAIGRNPTASAGFCSVGCKPADLRPPPRRRDATCLGASHGKRYIDS